MIGALVIYFFGVITGLLIGVWVIHSLNSKWSAVAQSHDAAFEKLIGICNDYEGLLEMHEELWNREHQNDEE